MQEKQKRKSDKIILRVILHLSACMLMTALSACGRQQAGLYSAEQTEDITAMQEEDETESSALHDADEKVAVHVCGAVLYPGVYYLEPGSIRQEALDAAGGFAEGAAVDYVNLAAQISGGERLYIPYADEVSGLMMSETASGEAADGTEALSGKVNLNTAAKEVLMTLPGIGDSKADAIIRYREETGLFQTVEDIMLVPGIKESTYNNIKEYIVVN